MRPSDLSPERWRRIDEIFDAALEAPPAERRALVAEACAGDDEMRGEVEALLDATTRAEPRFEEPASLVAAAIFAAGQEGSEHRRVGPFRILREIGRGGMGVVYLAEDTRLGRYVALKALPPYLGAGGEARGRFEAEARAVSALDHPNIATLYEIDETSDGQLYMVFAFYEGETLAERIARGPLPPDRAVEIATGIARGLGAAHRNRIVHRDVKPSNVLLTESGGIKLLDFGVAKMAGEELTGEGVRLGTIAYMSPEQVGGRPVDRRTDLWALGVVLYEMVTGRRPFRGRDVPSTLRSIVSEEPDPPESLRSDLPDALTLVVGKLLCKEPDGRYRRAEDLLTDLEAVRSGEAAEVALREPPPRRRDRIRRLAVLPLANLTGDPKRQHLVHGVHDAMIAELGRIHALEVVSRTSVMRFQDPDRSLPEIAEALDVDGVVEGSVARDGDGLAITVQLLALSPERHLWAETYRRGVGGVLDVAREAARSIATAAGVTVSSAEETRLSTTHPVDPEAFEAFSLGRFHLERRNREGLEQAERYLRRAIELDPAFAPAYATLAEALGSAAFFGLASPDERLPIVRSLLDRALSLDGESAAAHATLGAVRLFGDWDPAGAEAALRRAVELNPSYAYAYFLLAEVLSIRGRFRKALAAAERNAELEQYVPFASFGAVIVLNRMREFDRAIDRAREGVAFFPEFWQGTWLLGQALLGAGRHDEAVAELEAAAARSHRTPMALGTLGLAYALDGDREAALAVAQELEERAATEYVGGSNLAMIHAGLGERDRAFAWLDRACEQREMALVHLGDVVFDELRSDPRFGDLARRVGLEPRRLRDL